MIPAHLPEDPEVAQLRAQLAAQRKRKRGALVKHKRTTSQAVESGLRSTTFMSASELRALLYEESDEVIDADERQDDPPTNVE